MEKIILFTFIVLAAVLMVNGTNVSTTAPATTPLGMSNMSSTAAAGGNHSTKAPTTAPGGSTAKPTTAAAAIQPLAIFVLACAFLGLMH